MTTEPITHPTDGPVHEWFSLSYSNYQVIPRTFMQSMPIAWQERMVACLTELQEAFEHVPQAEVYKVEAATEHIVGEMGFDLLEEARITEDWYGGEKPPEGLSGDDLAEWRAVHEEPAPKYYAPDGREMDPHERVLLPTADPVPHYNRGRTYIQPRTGAPDSELAALIAHHANRCPAKHGALGRICERPKGHTGMHSGENEHGQGANWHGDAS